MSWVLQINIFIYFFFDLISTFREKELILLVFHNRLHMRYLCVFRLLETNSVNLDVLWDHCLLFQITMSNWCYVELLGCCFHLIFHLLVNHICLFLNRSSFYLIVFTIFWFFLVKVLNLLDLNLNRLWQSLFQITHVCILQRR